MPHMLTPNNQPEKLTLEQVREALPPNLRKAATQRLVDQLNNLGVDLHLSQSIRDNFLSYTRVLQEGRFKVQDYLNAVKYVSYKVMGYSNQESYCRTFPDRHQELMARGATQQEISAHVSMYNKNKLVNLILEQTLVPTWVLNQDKYQDAINVLAEEMHSANSAMARVQAANALLTHLKKPEAAGPLINIDMRDNSGMKELQNTLVKLAEKQQELIRNGARTKDIAAQPLVIEGTPEKTEKTERGVS